MVQVLLLEFAYPAKPAYPMSHFCSAKTLGLVRELLRLPSNPLEEIHMNNAKKTKHLSLRVSPQDKESILALADECGMSLADFVRVRLGQTRVRRTKIEREKLLHLACIGNNLNQLARWANTYKSSADSLLIISELTEIERELKCI
ncbi:MAG: hypothetical protein BA863_08800 [Desulfovibrio sp. S3730MH75]|nr:MAG: hypothetical protein BA863_08800 [Desulfovibrio sp. S3730MH75]